MDCFYMKHDGEPTFTLLGRDADAPQRIRDWCHARLAAQWARILDGTDDPNSFDVNQELAKIKEAWDKADAFDAWRATPVPSPAQTAPGDDVPF